LVLVAVAVGVGVDVCVAVGTPKRYGHQLMWAVPSRFLLMLLGPGKFCNHQIM
jgi:hypothetical protein